jgi:hypothetical protein
VGLISRDSRHLISPVVSYQSYTERQVVVASCFIFKTSSFRILIGFSQAHPGKLRNSKSKVFLMLN